jgi:hypothetical protein
MDHPGDEDDAGDVGTRNTSWRLGCGAGLTCVITNPMIMSWGKLIKSYV